MILYKESTDGGSSTSLSYTNHHSTSSGALDKEKHSNFQLKKVIQDFDFAGQKISKLANL